MVEVSEFRLEMMGAEFSPRQIAAAPLNLPGMIPSETTVDTPEDGSHQAEAGRLVPTVVVHHSELCRVGLVRLLDGTRFCITTSVPRLTDVLSTVPWDDGESVVLVGLDEEAPELLTQIGSLKAHHNQLRAVVLADRFNVDGLMGAIDAGANAYLLNRQLTAALLVSTLDLVCREQMVLPQLLLKPTRHASDGHPDNGADAIASEQLASTPAPWTTSRLDTRLTDREQLIVHHLVQGASNKHIARDLNLAEATVKVHMKAILRKIGARNRTQAAIWAVNHPQ